MIALYRAPRAMSSPHFGSPRGSLHPVLLQQGEVGSSPDRKWACQICRLWGLWESLGCLVCPVLSQGEESQEELVSQGFRPVSFWDVLRVLEYIFLDWMNLCPVARLPLCYSCYCLVSWNVCTDQNISAESFYLTAFNVISTVYCSLTLYITIWLNISPSNLVSRTLTIFFHNMTLCLTVAIFCLFK